MTNAHTPPNAEQARNANDQAERAGDTDARAGQVTQAQDAGAQAAQTHDAGAQTERAGDTDARAAGVAGRVLRPLLGGALLVGLVFLIFGGGLDIGAGLADLRATVIELGPLGPLIFALIYALAVVVAAPGLLLTLAAGAAFGIALGVPTVFLGAVLGSSVTFFIARYLARDAVAARIARHPRFAAVDRAVGEQGLRIVFLLRLSPLFPFNLLNYALGITRVRFRDYLVGALGMLPATFLYVYLGSLGAGLAVDASDAAQLGGEGADWGKRALQVVGVLATLWVTVVIARIAKRALAESGAS